jgi:hypothetical protein
MLETGPRAKVWFVTGGAKGSALTCLAIPSGSCKGDDEEAS